MKYSFKERPLIPQAEKRLLDLALEGKSEEFKSRVWEIVAKTGMDSNDPTFLLLVAQGRLEAYLEEIPEELGRQVEQLRLLTSKVMTAARTIEERGITRSQTGTFGAQARPGQSRQQEGGNSQTLLLIAVGASVFFSLVALFVPLVLVFRGGQCPAPSAPSTDKGALHSFS